MKVAAKAGVKCSLFCLTLVGESVPKIKQIAHQIAAHFSWWKCQILGKNYAFFCEKNKQFFDTKKGTFLLKSPCLSTFFHLVLRRFLFSTLTQSVRQQWKTPCFCCTIEHPKSIVFATLQLHFCTKKQQKTLLQTPPPRLLKLHFALLLRLYLQQKNNFCSLIESIWADTFSNILLFVRPFAAFNIYRLYL